MKVPGGTEGPWRWEAFDVDDRNERITVIDDGQRICDIYGFSNHPQHIGFANIISAAPDLYASLAEMIDSHRPLSHPIGAPSSIARLQQEADTKAYKRACAALAKARGEQS